MQFDEYLKKWAKQDKIRTPESFDARVKDTLRSVLGEAETRGAAVPVRRLGRRALAALVAAAILLVTATALAAVYFSRMQKFKDETQAALDDSYAFWSPEQIMPKGLTATVAGIEVSADWMYFCPADEFGNTANLQVGLTGYTPSARSAAAVSDVTLTVNNGEPIPWTYSESMVFEKQSDPTEGYKAYVTAGFPVAETPLREGNALTFAGKIDGEAFTMSYALDEATVAQLKAEQEQEYQQAVSVLEAIPQEATEVNLSFMGYTIKEVAVKDGFMYFTQQNVPEYWEARDTREISPEEAALTAEGIYAGIDVFPFIDGCPMLHEALGNVDQYYPDGYVYRTFIARHPNTLPARSLISFSGIVFYYEWATNTVISPADEAEQKQWRQQLADLIRKNAAYDAIFRFSQETEQFTATDLVFCNSLWGTVSLAVNTPDAYEAAQQDAPAVTINGHALNWVGEPQFHDEWPGGSQRGNMRHGYNYVGVAWGDLGDTFEVTVNWRGQTARFTLEKSSAVTSGVPEGEYDTIFGY